MKKWVTYGNWKVIIYMGYFLPQFALCPHDDFVSTMWIFLNTVSALICNEFAVFHKIFVIKCSSKEINAKISETKNNLYIFFLTLINFLFVSFCYGPKFCEHFELVLFMILLQLPIGWISQRLSKYIYCSEIHESIYDFY